MVSSTISRLLLRGYNTARPSFDEGDGDDFWVALKGSKDQIRQPPSSLPRGSANIEFEHRTPNKSDLHLCAPCVLLRLREGTRGLPPLF